MQVDRVCYTVVSDTPLNFATIQNPAIYLSGARVSIFSTLVPRLLVEIVYMIGLNICIQLCLYIHIQYKQIR